MNIAAGITDKFRGGWECLKSEIDGGAERVESLDMPKTLDQVSQDAAELTPEDQLKLARLLIDLCEAKQDDAIEVQAAWDAEIQRRMEELRSGKVRGIPLEQVKRRMQRHLVRED